jgi:hypothetical protein
MGAPYDNIPGVDSSDMFHPDIRTALANAPELMAAFAAKIHTHTYSDILVPELGTEDLDTIMTQGLYAQGNSVEATPASNYPTNVAGLLTVTKFVNGSYTFIFQRYQSYGNSNRVFNRTYYTGIGWTAWIENQQFIAAGTTAQYYRGDKTWQTLNSTAVGLGNVNNTSDANKPVSTAAAALFIPRWKPSTAYAAGEQVISPVDEVVASKTARTSGATWNVTEMGNWSGNDQAMVFVNTGFGWSGGNAPWDSGPLTESASALSSSQRSGSTTFASPGGISGTLNFNEPGVYDMTWYLTMSGNPGGRQYSIKTSGTWPGSPDTNYDRFGSIYVPDNGIIWETTCYAIGVRVPTAGLQIRFQGQQGNASTNVSVIRIRKVAQI